MNLLGIDLLGGGGNPEAQERQRQADKDLTADEEAALDQFKKKDAELVLLFSFVKKLMCAR